MEGIPETDELVRVGAITGDRDTPETGRSAPVLTVTETGRRREPQKDNYDSTLYGTLRDTCMCRTCNYRLPRLESGYPLSWEGRRPSTRTHRQQIYRGTFYQFGKLCEIWSTTGATLVGIMVDKGRDVKDGRLRTRDLI